VKFIIDNWMLLCVALASGGSLDPAGAVQLINRERAVVVDVSEPEEFAAGHIGGAKNVPFDLLEKKLTETVKNKTLPVILVCATGARSNRALAAVKKLGYEQAQALGGGLKAWKDANLPIQNT
jgi:rhodanese-related sulfurtransferase